MLRLLWVNLTHIWKSISFWCTVLVSLLLFLSSYTSYDMDTSITVFSAAFLPKEVLLSNVQFNTVSMICNATNGSFTLFVSMLVIFPFVNTISAERAAGVPRYMAFRSSRNGYVLGEVLTLVISGVSAVMLGFLLYGIFAYACFPGLLEYDADIVAGECEMLQIQYSSFFQDIHDLYQVVLFYTLSLFVYVLCNCAVGVLMTALLKNRYCILTIPFFVSYLIRQCCMSLNAKAYEGETVNELLVAISSYLSPNATLSLIYENSFKPIGITLLLHLGFFLLMCVLFCVIGTRRVDIGDF